MSSLIIASNPDSDPLISGVVQAVCQASGPGIQVLDLEAEGFETVMSAAEWRAYHTAEPILDEHVRTHAGLVMAAETLVFVYPTRWFGPPARLVGWLQRVLVPGVGFVFDQDHRVRPNLASLRSLAGVTTYDRSRWEMASAGDGGRRLLLRALRLNAPRRVHTAWLGLYPGADPARFLTRVDDRIGRL